MALAAQPGQKPRQHFAIGHAAAQQRLLPRQGRFGQAQFAQTGKLAGDEAFGADLCFGAAIVGGGAEAG